MLPLSAMASRGPIWAHFSTCGIQNGIQSAIEVFDLFGHQKAKRCYGWSFGEPEELIMVLELPPVDSAQTAGRSRSPNQKSAEMRTESQIKALPSSQVG
jgi:hypothetical protein